MIDKKSLSEKVADHIRTAIWNGQFAAGSLLREPILAKTIGVSRGPVREALDQLEREGLVVKERNKSARVARLSKKDLDEVYSLRLALERLAIEEAVQHAEEHDFEELKAVLGLMTAGLNTGLSEQEAAELDLQFHEAIVRASKHQRLYDFWKVLRAQTYIFLLQIRALLHNRPDVPPDFLRFTVEQHEILLIALQTRDRAYAASRLEQHIQDSYRRIVESYRIDDGTGPMDRTRIARSHQSSSDNGASDPLSEVHLPG